MVIIKGLKWLWRRWYLVLVFIGGVAGWLVSRQISPREAVANERKAISDQEKAELLAAERGAELANALADTEYRSTLRALTEKEKALVDGLRGDPGRRIRLLNRLSRRVSK